MKKKYADMDPIEELRAVRAELSRKFPTAKAFCEHLWKKYPGSVPPPGPWPKPDPQTLMEEKNEVASPRKGQRASTKTKTRANVRSAVRQRKSTAHTQ